MGSLIGRCMRTDCSSGKVHGDWITVVRGDRIQARADDQASGSLHEWIQGIHTVVTVVIVEQLKPSTGHYRWSPTDV